VKRTHVLALAATAGIVATTAALSPADAPRATAAASHPAAMATGAATPASPDRFPDPAAWTSRRLAAELVYVCVDAAATSTQRALARDGVGGITLLGNDAPSDLKSRLASVMASGPHGVSPMIASDEEGGEVQRLAHVIYPLPSAETMGTWSPSRITDTAYKYGLRMHDLGVLTDFGPDSDLGIPGYYIESLHRAFSRYPDHVATDVKAWMAGMRRARIVTTVKHWPGHGQATNTHTGAATIPPLSTLEKRDMIPFNAAFAAGVPAVMVGHLMSDGLTDGDWPATESPSALRYLRAKAGNSTLIVTDSLSMAAATSAVHLTPARAAVRALRSGADVALTCSSKDVIATVAGAIDSGRINRAKAVASARRLMPIKARAGLVQGYTGPMPSTISARPDAAIVPVGSHHVVKGRLSGGYRHVYLQEATSTGWHIVRTVLSGRLGYYDLPMPTGTAGVHRFRVTAPWAYPYASAASSEVTVTVS